MGGGEFGKGGVFVKVDDDKVGCRIRLSANMNTARNLQVWGWRF